MEEKEKENLAFWEKYKDVPDNAMKSFDNGKFKGTDINTMWRLKCLTESYGQCGFGWYYTIKDKQVVKCDNGDLFAFVEIELFLKGKDGNWSMPISGNGGNKLARVTKDGKLSTSDEAFKMATTDAIGVACRNLGIGATVYWENDKTKYNEETVKEEPKATAVQLQEIERLGCVVAGILSHYKIKSLNDLTERQAQQVIDLNANRWRNNG